MKIQISIGIIDDDDGTTTVYILDYLYALKLRLIISNHL